MLCQANLPNGTTESMPARRLGERVERNKKAFETVELIKSCSDQRIPSQGIQRGNRDSALKSLDALYKVRRYKLIFQFSLAAKREKWHSRSSQSLPDLCRALSGVLKSKFRKLSTLSRTIQSIGLIKIWPFRNNEFVNETIFIIGNKTAML